MKCQYCGKDLINLESEKNAMMCPKCSIIYHEKELERMKDAEMLEEDMKIWRKIKKLD